MPRSTTNRARRRKRRETIRRKAIERVASKLRLKRGSRPYYEPFRVRVRRAGKKNYRISWQERPTKMYFDMINQLIEMSKGITVELPQSLIDDVLAKRKEEHERAQ